MQKKAVIFVIALILLGSTFLIQGKLEDKKEAPMAQDQVSQDPKYTTNNETYLPINATTIGEITEPGVWFGYQINSSDDKLYRIEFRSLNSQTYTLINYHGSKLNIRDKTLIGDTPLISIFNGTKLKYLAIKGPIGLFNLTLSEITDLSGLVIDQPIPITGNNNTFITEYMLFWMYFSYTANTTGDYYLDVNRGINRLYVHFFNSTGFRFMLAFPNSIIQLTAGETYILGMWVINYEPIIINIAYRPNNPYNSYISNQIEVGNIYRWDTNLLRNGEKYIDSNEILSDIETLSIRINSIPIQLKYPEPYTGFDVFVDKERIIEISSMKFNISTLMFILPTILEFENNSVLLLNEAIENGYFNFLPYFEGQLSILGEELVLSEDGVYELRYSLKTGILTHLSILEVIDGNEFTLELNLVQYSSSTNTDSISLDDQTKSTDEPLFSVPFPFGTFIGLLILIPLIKNRKK